jgi:hypothetical protein
VYCRPASHHCKSTSEVQESLFFCGYTLCYPFPGVSGRSIQAAIASRVIHVAAEVTSEVKRAVVESKPKRVSIKREGASKPVILERRDSSRPVAAKANCVALSTQEAVFVAMPQPGTPEGVLPQSTKGAKGKFFSSALSRKSVCDGALPGSRPVTPATDSATRASPLPSLQSHLNLSRPPTAHSMRPGTAPRETQAPKPVVGLPPATIPSEAFSPVSQVLEWKDEIVAIKEPVELPGTASSLPVHVVPLSAKASFRESLLGRCASRQSMKLTPNESNTKISLFAPAESAESAFRKVLSPVGHNRRASVPESSVRFTDSASRRPGTAQDVVV